MKKSALFLALSALATGSAFAASFVNGGFETGNLSGWNQGGGYRPYNAPPAADPSVYNGGPSNNTIMNVGNTDPITGASVVYNGNHSVRVNDSTNDYSISTIYQSVTGYSDNDIYFQWNAVLEESHAVGTDGYFSLTLHDDTDGVDLISRVYSSNGVLPGGWGTFGNWFSSGWVLEHIDLTTAGAGGTSIVGHDFTLTLLAADCAWGGHAGYVYLDGFAPTIVPPGRVPEPATLALMGLGLIGLGAARRRKAA